MHPVPEYRVVFLFYFFSLLKIFLNICPYLIELFIIGGLNNQTLAFKLPHSNPQIVSLMF